MQLILPNAVRLRIQCHDDETATFRYEEKFKSRALVVRTFKILQQLNLPGLKLTCSKDGLWLRFTGRRIPKTQLGSMMVTEFMSWSSIGEMKVRDLFLGGIVAGLQSQKNPPPTVAKHGS